MHLDERQTLGRRGRADERAVACVDGLRDRLCVTCTAPDFKERADD